MAGPPALVLSSSYVSSSSYFGKDGAKKPLSGLSTCDMVDCYSCTKRKDILEDNAFGLEL